jgi:hypothetical protein
MKNRRRVFLGLVLLAATFLFTIQDGVLGHLMAQFLGYLFGQSGAAVAAVLMLTAGVLLIVPPGAVGRFFRWSTHSREARVEKVMREMDEDVIARVVERAVERALRGRAKVESPVVSGTIVSPAERMRLDDVRTALRSLQYRPHEFEPIVRTMDPKQPLEVLVKGALKTLQAATN